VKVRIRLRLRLSMRKNWVARDLQESCRKTFWRYGIYDVSMKEESCLLYLN
jgi:hypothetical protein